MLITITIQLTSMAEDRVCLLEECEEEESLKRRPFSVLGLSTNQMRIKLILLHKEGFRWMIQKVRYNTLEIKYIFFVV